MGLYTWGTLDVGSAKHITLGVTTPPLSAGITKTQFPRHTLFQDEDTVAVQATSGALKPSTAQVFDRQRVSDGGSVGAATGWHGLTTSRYLTISGGTSAGFVTTSESWGIRVDDRLQYTYLNSFSPEITGAALTRLRECFYGGDALPWAVRQYSSNGESYLPVCPSAPIVHPGTVAPVFKNVLAFPASGPVDAGACFGPASSRLRFLVSVQVDYTNTKNIWCSFYYFWENGTTLRVLAVPQPLSSSGFNGCLPWWGLPPSVEYYLTFILDNGVSNPPPVTTFGLLFRQWVVDDPFTGSVTVLDTIVEPSTAVASTGSWVSGGHDYYSYGYIKTTVNVGTMHARCIRFMYIPLLNGGESNGISSSAWHRLPPTIRSNSIEGQAFGEMNTNGGEDELTNISVGLVVDL